MSASAAMNVEVTSSDLHDFGPGVTTFSPASPVVLASDELMMPEE